jgi:hypothetical protein
MFGQRTRRRLIRELGASDEGRRRVREGNRVVTAPYGGYDACGLPTLFIDEPAAA